MTIEWLDQTVERGMILDEQCFDPLLPLEERGKGARDDPSLMMGKRQRLLDSFTDPDGPRRKLRKTASMKLSSQRETVWGDILGRKSSASGATETSPRDDDGPSPHPAADADADTDADVAPVAPAPSKDAGIFSNCSFYVQGFNPRRHERVVEYVASHGGRICQTPDELHLAPAPSTPWHRFTLVPQDSHATPPPPPDAPHPAAETVTEFFIERCGHHKRLYEPRDHVLGRPFPAHPIRGFEALEVNSAGFFGIDLRHMELAVQQLGARYEEKIRRRTTSVLVCRGLETVRKEKLALAVGGGIPVVREAWLWDCVAKGERLGFERYMFPELKQKAPGGTNPSSSSSSSGGPAKARRTTLGGFEVDEGAFAAETAGGGSKGKAGTTSTGFHTARTHIFENLDDFSSSRNKPLKEVASNAAPRPESPAPLPPAVDDELPPTAKPGDDGSAGQAMDIKEASRRKERDEAQGKQEDDEVQRREREEAKRREEASRKERELLAFSTKLTSLTDGAESFEGTKKRRRGILGRAASNVSAPGSFERRQPAAGPEEERDEEEGRGEEEPSLLTQVGYYDPGAAEARENLMGGLERRVKTR